VEATAKPITKISDITLEKSPQCKTISVLEKLIYILGFVVLVAIRMPKIWRGRFWAEEGTVFLQNAWHEPWYKALFFVYGGYLNLIANFATIVARNILPLAQAPYASSLIALVIQTVPTILLCCSRQKWLQNQTTLIAALLLVALPSTHEIWISSIGSQFHLNLCTVLVLVLETQTTGAIKWLQYALLVVAPLTGLGPSLLLPLFIARAIIDKSKQRAVQATLLGLASAAQFFIFYQPQTRPPLGISLPLLLHAMFMRYLVEPFLGWTEATPIGNKLHDAFVHGNPSIPIMVITLALFIAFGIAVWRSKKAEPIYLFLSGILMTVVPFAAALGDRSDFICVGWSSRYVFAPQVSYELAILSLSQISSGWTRKIYQGIIVWLLVIGLHDYFFTPSWVSCGPNWQAEVAQWQKNPNCVLSIWPGGWFVRLQPRPR
jgi:hypothetical protein